VLSTELGTIPEHQTTKGEFPMFKKILFTAALICFFVGNTGAAEFPYREKYPHVPFITTEDLAAKDAKGEVVIVDVRSSIEFNVIHPRNAVHLPLSKKSFTEDVRKLMADHPGKAFAFYCNGVDCIKSYEAADKAIKELNSKNSYVYDAGIPEWSQVHPELTLLLGTPLEDKSRLISKAEFKSHCMPFDKFKAKAADQGSVVIDVRDFVQASGKLPGLETARTIPLDQFIPNFVQKGSEKDKFLLIFDQVNKQTAWLMYYLKKHGYTNYAFLEGGATGVLGSQKYK
jgi:rhodanese-related sulfurtransferase